ncbi:pentatricopeptide repeat-containing protein At2g29760, chloroplastic-like [Rutidosis leptorrhynchoides]|uniref:pentatricopeptide repeat-containing protein At2g29760, chloroplastic-like n=1 Tax=Rutidosis leptorrhynchoides TaxID=125765 RepID=UPI003A990CBC
MALSASCISILPNDIRNWNKLVKNNMLNRNPKKALLTYIEMQEHGFQGDNFTFPILLKAVASLGTSCSYHIGLAIHGQTLKAGFSDHPFVQTALLNLYISFHCFDDACKVFRVMPVKDVVAWNSMLDAYASKGKLDDAFELFSSMPVKDLTSFNIMISGFAKAGQISSAKRVFDQMPERDVVSWNSMLLAYIEAGDMECACELFSLMEFKNVITWNTMITGFVREKLYAEAVHFLNEMKAENYKPDYVTIVGVLSACAHLGSLENGVKLHLYAMDNRLTSIPHITTALIDMYSKCGCIQNSLAVFYKSQIKDVYCWNSMISSLALHGFGNAALKLFEEMNTVTNPDSITFIGMLSACSHSGLVKEGCKLFSRMEWEFGVAPTLEHYACIVDLLCRAKLFTQAIQFIEDMPFEPGEAIWGSLLSACVVHRDLEIGERVIKMISENASYLSDGEVLMFSNLYASCGLMEEANRWRNMLNDSGIVKNAGYSSIQVNGRFHKFLAGDKSGMNKEIPI